MAGPDLGRRGPTGCLDLEIVKETVELRETIKCLEGKLKAQKETKVKAQKVASKWRRRNQTQVQQESKEIRNLSEQVLHLEIENDMIREELAKFLEDKEVKTFQDGRYKDKVREVILGSFCYKC